MDDATIRIVIADDQPLFSSGLQMLIDAQSDMVCIGVAADGSEAIAAVDRHRPDVVLMDLRMPIMNGIDATRSILQKADGNLPQVIVLTTIQRDEAVFQALNAGATAFLTKDATPATLLGAIRSASMGHSIPEASESLGVIKEFGHPLKPSGAKVLLASLSPRELEIFAFVARGLSNSEISKAMYLSDATVKSHVRAVLKKLGLRSRVQIVIMAYENNLAEI